jgi:uncharacterized protein YutE (UPF0331/DUF86 family)
LKEISSKGDTSMVNETMVLKKLSELEEYHKQIVEVSNATINEYQKDWRLQRIVERTLQMMIETCSDIAGHIISDRKFRVPNSYAETFEVLRENGIIADTLFDTMRKMAKFRNIVVHHYDNVDAEIVVGILKRNLSDFIAFRDSIIKYIKTDAAIEKRKE